MSTVGRVDCLGGTAPRNLSIQPLEILHLGALLTLAFPERRTFLLTMKRLSFVMEFASLKELPCT